MNSFPSRRKPVVLSQLDIPWLRQPLDAQLDALTAELHEQWLAFNRELRQGKLKHLEYDSESKKLYLAQTESRQ